MIVMKRFHPHPLLRQRDLMTLASAFWLRSHSSLPPSSDRVFEVEPGSRILAKCHWQSDPRNSPTLVLVHGLEGSSESDYMKGIADRAFQGGLNVLRMNQRTCGDSELLTPTLYNSGRSGDFRFVFDELIERDNLSAIVFAGYSMGGNLVLKMAGELGDQALQLRGVCGVCPTFDIASCVDASSLSRNFLYRRHFVSKLKARMLRKAQMYPGIYNLNGLNKVRTLREFDDFITAPYGGYRNADDYYYRASALRVAANIRVPTLLIAAQDDPLVPTHSFSNLEITGNPNIRVAISEHGGHCSFISNDRSERFWAEARVVEFCLESLAWRKTIPQVSQAKG